MKVLVVHCHPLEESLVAAARDRALAGLRAAGHEVRLTDLYADGFRPELSEWERVHHLDPPDGKPEIARYAADLRWCEALVLVYPTWCDKQNGHVIYPVSAADDPSIPLAKRVALSASRERSRAIVGDFFAPGVG